MLTHKNHCLQCFNHKRITDITHHSKHSTSPYTCMYTTWQK